MSLFPALLALTLTLSAEEAQDKDPGPPILHENFVKELEEGLKLSDKQKPKVRQAVESARPKIKERWERVRRLQEDMKKEHEALRREMQEALEKIRSELDLDQKEKFDRMKMRPHGAREKLRKKMMEQGPGEFPPERWHEPGTAGKELPPQIREHIERRMRSKNEAPPSGEWDDRMPVKEIDGEDDE